MAKIIIHSIESFFAMNFKKYHFFYLYFLHFLIPVQGISYLYPVLELENRIFLLYQEYDQTSLLEWDPQTKQVSPALAPWYNPTHIVLLPHKQAFSFIDEDRIYIKFLNQRSAYTIPLQEPLYNFSVIQWVDDTHLCCSAMKNGHFGIFEISSDGTVIEKIVDPIIDCLYPQKLGENLYYIARMRNNNTYSYTIRRSLYKNDVHSVKNDEICIDCGAMPIAFLWLHPVEGNWVLSYEIDHDTQSEWVQFCYYELVSYKKLEKRFSFKVLKKYLFDSVYRLNESLLPLLPRVRGNNVYFVSSDVICVWNRFHNKVNVYKSYKSLCTVPLYSGLYGGSLSNDLFSFFQYESNNMFDSYSLKNRSKKIVRVDIPSLN